MEYFRPTSRTLKSLFGEHYRKMKKPKRFDNFPYRYLKRTGHSPTTVSFQPAEKIIYEGNFTSKFNIIKMHETELKWILLQTPFSLRLNDNIYLESNMWLAIWLSPTGTKSSLSYIITNGSSQRR